MDSHVFQFMLERSLWKNSSIDHLDEYFHRSNVIGIVKLRDFALITPEQYHLTVKHMMEFHTRTFSIF